MNHMTPRMELKGLYQISQVTAEDVAHYKFSYDEEGRVVEIINSHPDTRGEHPLSDLGVHRVSIHYAENTESRTYFDTEDKPVRNLRKVFKEVYTYDADGFKSGLSFYDEDDKRIESGWNVATYKWSSSDSMVLERRYDLNGKPQVLAPFFTLGSTLIEYNEQGLIVGQFNVDENGQVIAHESGMASYHDIHDTEGNVVLILYRDIKGRLINAADGDFASILLIRNLHGNVSKSMGIDEKGKYVWSHVNDYDINGNPMN